METFVIDRIKGLYLPAGGELEPSIERIMEDIAVPMATAQNFNVGMGNPTFNITGTIQEGDATLALRKAMQLFELANNLDYRFHYIYFPPSMMENIHNGFYVMRPDFKYSRLPGVEGRNYSFNGIFQRKGNLSTHRWATKWSAAPEIFSGWGSLVSATMVSLPNAVTNVGETVLETRSGENGSNQIIDNPIKSPVLYSIASAFFEWYSAECEVFDTVLPNNTDETTWLQVFAPFHVFTGDRVFQNNLLRYKVSLGVGTFYAYDTISAVNAWVAVGQLKTAVAGNLDCSITHLQITRMCPTEIQWVELRQNGARTIQLLFALRMGARFCKCSLQTFNTGIDTATYVRLYSGNNATAYFSNMFNSQVSGAAGGGNLAQDTVSNYEMGYAAGRNLISGFALLTQPTQQPYDVAAAGHSLAESNVWLANELHTFFVVGIPFAVAGLPGTIVAARTASGTAAQETLQAVVQKIELVEEAQYSVVNY